MNTPAHKTLRRQDVTFEEKDQALRDDVRTLGAMVGELIREQNGEALFEMVENARLSSIRRREGNEKPGEELVSLVRDLEPGTATQLVLPQFPAIAQDSLGICWRDCDVENLANCTVRWGFHKPLKNDPTSCGRFRTRLRLSDAAGVVKWRGRMNLTYSRTWLEVDQQHQSSDHGVSSMG